MFVADILKTKGGDIVSTSPGETIGATAALLKQHRIGAVLVLSEDGGVAGVISERDIVRALAEPGGKLDDLRVGDIMTRDVITCEPTNSIAEVMKMMTERRIRHLPVIDGEKLAGIISIGDVVKHRLVESQMETEELRQYVMTSG